MGIFKIKKSVKQLLNLVLQYLPVVHPIKAKFEINEDNSHCFVGYYDYNPVNRKSMILYHKVSLDYSSYDCPPVAALAIKSVEDCKATKDEVLFHTKACNWQLGSRATWFSDNLILFNDIDEENRQISRLFDVKNRKVKRNYDVPFWQHSKNSSLAVSLNFSRLYTKRPGYGYVGENKYGNQEYIEVYEIKTGRVVWHLRMPELLQKANLAWISKFDPYLNHVSWAPDGKSFVSLLHFADPKTNTRQIYPIFCDLETYSATCICDSGYFSHHTWNANGEFLAYLKLNNRKTWAVWHLDWGWRGVHLNKNRDGHPCFIGNEQVVIDTYPNKFGLLELSEYSLRDPKFQKRLGTIRNHSKYFGAQRCDLHPRIIGNDEFVIDIPSNPGRSVKLGTL